jgi:molybdopterin synthase catalytic subunit
MRSFQITNTRIDKESLRSELENNQAGACVIFEGIVRNHNDGQSVEKLEYDAYPALAEKEGLVILEDAVNLFKITDAYAIHRYGLLEIGEAAVWVGVLSAHRKEAFLACEYIIDQIKKRVPIWKKEHYSSGKSEWIQCHE